MENGITSEDVKKWIEDLKKNKSPEPRRVKIWANDGAFDKMPDKMFIAMYEDSRVEICGTKALHKKIKERYKKLK